MKQINLRDLPEDAQREVYDFYLFIQQRALEKQGILQAGKSDDEKKFGQRLN